MLKKLLSIDFGMFIAIAPFVLDMFIILIFGLIGQYNLESLSTILMAISSLSLIGFAILSYVILIDILK